MEIRNALLAGVFHILLPQRMEHFDYTYAYEYSFFAFSLTKPKLRPKWQSLYYPLANEVWVTIVVTLFLTLAVMLLVMCALVLLMCLFQYDGGYWCDDGYSVVCSVSCLRK